MRLLLGMFKHETNTFSPVPTPFQRFFNNSPDIYTGELARKVYQNTGTGLGGFLKIGEQHGASMEIAIAASARPSGVMSKETYERLCKYILDAVAKGGYDGILLDLHGAMVAEGFEDGDGELLRQIRAIDSDTPIGVVLDMHANIYADMVENCNVITGYHTYPHIDMDKAGERAASIIVKTIKKDVNPTLSWQLSAMLPHVLRQGTANEPNRSLQQRCIDLERDNEVLAASIFTGFPNADITNAGLSVVVCTDARADVAEKYVDELAQMAWKVRDQFVYESKPLDQSIHEALEKTDGPVVMLDHCDNSASGGTMDTTMVLKRALDHKMKNAVFYAIYDPSAAQEAISAGIGNVVTLSLGGKMAMPAITQENTPITVTGRVKLISDGHFKNFGPMYKDVAQNTGPTVVLDVDGFEIVIVSEHIEPFDLNCLLSLGIDPKRKQFLILKSRVHWRAGYEKLAKHIIECEGLGVTGSNYQKLPFKKLRRPIYPLDSFI